MPPSRAASRCGRRAASDRRGPARPGGRVPARLRHLLLGLHVCVRVHIGLHIAPAVLPLLAASDLPAMPRSPRGRGRTWSWSAAELRQVAALERRTVTLPGRIGGADAGRRRGRGGEAGERHRLVFSHWRLVSAHWTVETEVSRRFTAEVGLFMDRFFETFTRLFRPLAGRSRVRRRPAVIVFAGEERYTELFDDGSRGHYRYRFEGGSRFTELHLYTFVRRPRERIFSSFYHPILVHEGAHVMLRRLLGTAAAPRWLDEGLATYMQFWDLRRSPEENLAGRVRPPSYHRALREALGEEAPPALADLLAITDWNPDGMGPIAVRRYALAESFIDLLLSSDRGRRRFRAIIRRVRAGTAPVLEARSIERLEPAWHAHLLELARP